MEDLCLRPTLLLQWILPPFPMEAVSPLLRWERSPNLVFEGGKMEELFLMTNTNPFKLYPPAFPMEKASSLLIRERASTTVFERESDGRLSLMTDTPLLLRGPPSRSPPSLSNGEGFITSYKEEASFLPWRRLHRYYTRQGTRQFLKVTRHQTIPQREHSSYRAPPPSLQDRASIPFAGERGLCPISSKG